MELIGCVKSVFSPQDTAAESDVATSWAANGAWGFPGQPTGIKALLPVKLASTAGCVLLNATRHRDFPEFK